MVCSVVFQDNPIKPKNLTFTAYSVDKRKALMFPLGSVRLSFTYMYTWGVRG